MRTLSKPSTAKCTLEHYTAFLLAEAQSARCVRLSEVSGGQFAHDAANRFLNREDFSPRDLFEEMRPLIVLEEGILSVDDTVLDKPHSQEGKTDLVGYFWSGLHGKAVKGINLVTLFYGEVGGLRVPVNFRVVDKAEGKTKNDLFREMVSEVLGWGLAPALVTADSWYSGVENLRFLRDQGLSFMIALEKNRLVSEQRGEHVRVEDVEPSRVIIVRSSRSATPKGSLCVGSEPSATISSVACVRSWSWNSNAGAERSKAGTASNVTSPTRS